MEGIELREAVLQSLAKRLGESGRTLDVATGSGYLIRYLPDRSVGVDIDRDAIRRTKRELPQHDYVQADATCLPFRDGAFDHVVAWSALVHIPTWRQALVEMERTLRLDGMMVICEPVGSAVRAFRDSQCNHIPPTGEDMNKCFDGQKLIDFGSKRDGFLILWMSVNKNR